MSETNGDVKPTSPASEVSYSSSGIAKSGSLTRPSGPASDTTLASFDRPAQDDQDLNQPVHPTKPNLQVMKIDKPHSKTAIGQVVQKLKILQHLSTFELHLESKQQGGDWTYTRSCRLRRKAAQAWIRAALAREYQEHVLINVGPSIDAVRLIVHIADKEKRKIAVQQARICGVKELVIQGKQVKCTVREIPETAVAVPEQSFKFLLRQTSKKLGNLEPLPSSMDCNRFFSPLVPGSSRSTSPIQPEDYQLYLRHQPSVSVEEEQLKVDFDLVPCIPGKSLDRVVLDMSGLPSLKGDGDEIMKACLPQINRSLVGAHVRCAYIPGAKTNDGREKATILTPENINSGRAFQIRGIIMPGGQDDGFDLVVGGNRITTYDYFATMLPDNKKLNTALPLVKDDTGALIPIELVFADGPQPLLRFGHLNEAIRGTVSRYMEREGATKMFDISKSLVERFPPAFNGEHEQPLATLEVRGRARFTQCADSSLTKKAKLDRPREAANRLAAPLNILDARISLLFVEDGPEQAVDHGLLNKSSHGIQSLSFNVKHPYDIRTAKQITGQNDLEGVGTNSDLLFVIIENRRQSKTYTRDIRAHLHRYADRRLGIPLVCTTTQHLASVMKGPLDPFNKHFPASLRAKINQKLGGTNFQTSIQSVVRGTGLMIAGGHIAHRAYSKKSQNNKSPPSISSIVATRDNSCSQYLGSVRIHDSTVLSQRPKYGRYHLHLQTYLVGMKDMMKERFDKCDTPPQQVLFFRDSMRFDETTQGFEDECKMIRLAYEDVFGHLHYKPQITYVVVNKNTEIKTIPTASAKPTAVPLFNYVVTDHATAKYRYYVIKNEIGYSEEQLKTLTRHINESSQISTQLDCVAKAYPLKLAKKLSDRTYDYFKHFNMPYSKRTKNLDQTTYDDEVAKETVAALNVITNLGIETHDDHPERRALPWMKSLDDYMFYL